MTSIKHRSYRLSALISSSTLLMRSAIYLRPFKIISLSF